MSVSTLLEALASAPVLEVACLSDADLMATQRVLAAGRRAIESQEATVAAEVARRSRPELGKDGLAQRLGARTPEKLVQSLTGSSTTDARRLVRVGTLVDSLASEEPTEPWLVPVMGLSVEQIDVIRIGLGKPSESVPVQGLLEAAKRLAAEASNSTIDRLALRARELRDYLDIEGIALREEERRSRRFLRLYPQLDGMTRISGLLDPESAAIVVAAVDNVTSPRRGGPRFVSDEDKAREERIIADERTTEQLALDALVEMVNVAIRATDHQIFGSHAPEVRVLVTLSDLEKHHGMAFIEGQSEPVSIATAERHACEGGYLPIVFDDKGQPLHLGRSQKPHSTAIRKAAAARDGGCIAFDCDRPPTWTEVHHIVPWSEGGETNVEDAVLLCRHHHMLIHNAGWQIVRRGADYWLMPPPGSESGEEPILLEKKSAVLRRLLAA